MALPSTARAFWVAAPGRGEIRDERVHGPGEESHDLLRIRAEYSGISRGTEALVFTGRVPPSEYTRMRAPFQQGEFPAPVKYGYASVGVVEEGPYGWEGRHVFCLYPHQTRYAVPATAVHMIPHDVPPARAVLAAYMETALNGLWDARPPAGALITVIGAGTVGLLVAWLAKQMIGCDVEIVDINERRALPARELGLAFAPAADASAGRDIVIHTSASESGLQLALRIAAFEATIIELSWFGDQLVALPLGGAFHSQRLTIRSSQVGTIPAAQRARWDTRRRMALALALLKDPTLDVLITGESAFDDLPEVMARLARDPGDTLCHRIRY